MSDMDEVTEYLQDLKELNQKRAYYRRLFHDLDDYVRKIEKNLWYLESMVDYFHTMSCNVSDESEGEMVELFNDLASRGYNDITVASEEIQTAYNTLKQIRDQVGDKVDEYRRKINQCILPSN